MKPCVTVSLVSEARGGPFIFWDDLKVACEKAVQLGYAAVEIFPRAASEIRVEEVRRLLKEHKLAVAAFGTGGGWVRHKLSLTSADPEIRARARAFVTEMIELAGKFGAAVIVGSMQGKWDAEVSRSKALNYLGEALTDLADVAHSKGVTLLYEHLNRYETNLLNRVEDVIPFVKPFNGRVKILADLFHMSIEEASIPDAIRMGGELIGHVHFADSNRRPAGYGHTDFPPVFDALREIGYEGYVSAEAFSYPDAESAARQTLEKFREFSRARS